MDNNTQNQLKSEEKVKIHEFQKLIIPELQKLQIKSENMIKYTDQIHLIRLLIARNWIVAQAFTMWKRWVQWRLDYRADEINEDQISSELAQGKAYWHGHDKLGNPTLIIKACKHFPGRADQETLVRFFIYLIEKGINLADKAGTGKVSVIWDRNQVTSKNWDSSMLSFVKKIIGILQDNYAERLHMSVVLYPNWFAKSVMAIIKPFLSDRNIQKIKLVENKQQLQEFWDANNLLVEHGGTSPYIYSWPLNQKGQVQQINEQMIKVSIVDQDEEEQKLNQMADQLLKENNIQVNQIGF